MIFRYDYQRFINLMTGTQMVLLSKIKTAPLLRPVETVTGAMHSEYLRICLDFSIGGKERAPNESPQLNRA
jgi:hypothetical protein